MSAHAQNATWPVPLRWLIIPAAVWSAVAAAVVIMKRRAQEPSVTPMSDDWLHTQNYDRTGHD